MTAHEAIPDPESEWLSCMVCGMPCMEAIYTGGWMHTERLPHPFAAFVYSDGALSDKVCTRCAQPSDATIHQRPAGTVVRYRVTR